MDAFFTHTKIKKLHWKYIIPSFQEAYSHKVYFLDYFHVFLMMSSLTFTQEKDITW